MKDLIKLFKKFVKETNEDNDSSIKWCAKEYEKTGERWGHLHKNTDIETFIEWLNTKDR